MTKATIKLHGIKALCGETKCLPDHGYGPGCYEVFCDCSTGQVWGNYQVSKSTWTVYDDPNVISCGWITTPATMGEIAAMVKAKLAEWDLVG